MSARKTTPGTARFGWCGHHASEASHMRCPGEVTNGNGSTVTCACPLPHHAAAQVVQLPTPTPEPPSTDADPLTLWEIA